METPQVDLLQALLATVTNYIDSRVDKAAREKIPDALRIHIDGVVETLVAQRIKDIAEYATGLINTKMEMVTTNILATDAGRDFLSGYLYQTLNDFLESDGFYNKVARVVKGCLDDYDFDDIAHDAVKKYFERSFDVHDTLEASTIYDTVTEHENWHNDVSQVVQTTVEESIDLREEIGSIACTAVSNAVLAQLERGVQI